MNFIQKNNPFDEERAENLRVMKRQNAPYTSFTNDLTASILAFL